MRAKQIHDMLLRCLENPKSKPRWLWGPPGIGKSSIPLQVCQERNIPMWDVRLTTHDPTDLKGIPIPTPEGRARWLPSDELPDRGPGILFLDELNTAPPLVQASAYQLVLDRKMGKYRLPDGVYILAAGNRSTDRAVTHRLPSPMANRFIHIDYDVNLEDWQDWAIKAKVRPEVIGFLAFRKDRLMLFDPSRDEHAFATPRSWEMVSTILEEGHPLSSESEQINGAVGAGVGIEFAAFRKLYGQLPTPEEALRKKIIPDKLDVKYALAMSIATGVDPKDFELAVRYSLEDALGPEFAVLIGKIMADRDKKALGSAPSFQKWAGKYKDVIV